MTKIKNYTIKNPVIGTDKWIGSNGETGETKNFSAEGVANYVATQLTPTEGGVLGVTEIDIETLDTDIATTVNAMTPSYDVAPYELVHFVVEGRVYILKVVDETIGDGGVTLTNDDFIILPVNTGPTGPSGSNGSNGTNGTNGVNADMTRTSVTSLTIANTGSISATYTASTNLGWLIGTRLRFANDASNYMEGTVTAVSSTSVTVTLDNSVGSGTYTAWNIGIAGDKGTNGADGDIITENTAGTLTITTQSDVEIPYIIDFQKQGDKVFVSGYIEVETVAGVPANTEVLEFIDADYEPRTGNATVIIGSNGVSGDSEFILFSSGKIFLSQATAAPVRLTFNGFYFTN